jgi:4a-hydroxytetrahydrobiopterin dehydratase
MKLAEKKCKPCERMTKPLSRDEARMMAVEIPNWQLKEKSLEREFKFGNFREAMDFVNDVAEIAEVENHHPDIHVYYNRVNLQLSTHKIGGLSENDFILASRIDRLLK